MKKITSIIALLSCGVGLGSCGLTKKKNTNHPPFTIETPFISKSDSWQRRSGSGLM